MALTMIGIRNQLNKLIRIMEMIFIMKPVFTISFNFNLPLAKTIALGGVPIGNMPAQLAASVMGITNIIGFTCSASANEETTGANTITCATLLITSLMNIERTVTATTKRKRFEPA